MVEHKTGQRIDCEGHIGTIKYVGTVGNTQGQWLGIDWDDQTRGKHNGTFEGIQYFDTWHPTSGSFIRPGKANFGITCPEAIKIRYGFIDDELAGMDRATIDSVKKSFNAPFVEMVGFSKVNKKQSKFDQLKIICLQEQCISSAGFSREFADLCPQVEELDLSRNLLNSWKVVAEICSELHNLEQLNVSGNDLPVEENMEFYSKAFSKVKHLTLGKMKYDWTAVIKCLQAFPSIQQLTVSYNNIETINDLKEDLNLMKLTDLSLEDNHIHDWNEVLKLGKLSCLKSLNLNSNKIETIRFYTNEPTDKTNLFPSLLQLHISDNIIKDWRSISELEKLKSLEDLRFRENPVLNCQNIQTGIQLVIARIKNLKLLNGTEILSSERRGAEYDYLKMFAASWKNSDGDVVKRKEFITNHPRFPALVEKYGVPDTLEPIKNTQLSSNVITVEFVCPDNPNIKSIKKKLLKNMDVQKLMGVVQRLFRINGKIPTLSFVRPKVSEDEILLDKPLQELNYYLIDEGDLIFVRW